MSRARASEGVLSIIGKTPLVRLSRIFAPLHFNLFAKLEALNPGGSTKDRPALSIIQHGIATGEIRPDTVVVESSSGNMGIGLAQVCLYYGLKLICVVDPKTTAQNLRLLEAYGAEIDLVTEPDPITGEYLQARLDRVQSLRASIENSFWPNQYANICNPEAHRRTMHEMIDALGRAPDYVLCATSTYGTLRGCSEYIRENELRTKVIAVDAEGSVIFGGPRAKRLIPGHGASVRPALFDPDLAHGHVQVKDLDCVVGCRLLAKREAILAGGSSGAVLMALESIKDRIPRGSACVVILADRGERYLDTIFSNQWVADNFGDVSHLWRSSAKDHPVVTATRG